MKLSFDDMNIGLSSDKRYIEISLIPRPPGFETNREWYEYATVVINNLENKLVIKERI